MGFTLEELLAEKERRQRKAPVNLHRTDVPEPGSEGQSLIPTGSVPVWGGHAAVPPGLVEADKRAGEAVNAGAATTMHALDTMTAGGMNRLSGGAIERAYSPVREQIPAALANGIDIASYLPKESPVGVIAETGAKAGQKLADPLLRALSKRAAGRVAAKAAGVTAGGALGNTAIAGARNAIAGENNDLSAAAGSGAALGGALGAVPALAREGAEAMRARSPDLTLLAEHGLEPRLPIPGTSAVKSIEGHPAPMEGIPNKVTPASRGSAGTVAAETIVPAIKAHEQANNREFGRQMGPLQATEGKELGSVTPLFVHIDQAAQDPALPDASRNALARLRDRMMSRVVDVKGGQMLMSASDINAMREYADGLAGEIKTAKVAKGDIPLVKAASVARGLLTQTVQRPMIGPLQETGSAPNATSIPRHEMPVPGLSEPDDIGFDRTVAESKTVANPPPLRRPAVEHELAPGIADLNAKYAKTAEGMKRRYRLLGIRSPGTQPTEDTLEKAGRMVTSRGEESKAAGGKTGREGHRIDRLKDMGVEPPVLDGTKTPDFPSNANTLLDRPQVMGAIERLQLSPPQAFNAAKSPSMLAHLAAAAPARTVYPALRAASKISPGRLVLPADQLIGTIRKRSQERKRALDAQEQQP